MQIYLENAASTKIEEEVLEVYTKELKETYGNPSASHEKGLEAKVKVDGARKTIGEILNAKGSEIIFTGSGTEANNIAIFGAVKTNAQKGKHIITGKIEHPSVLECFKALETEGYEVTYIGTDKDGIIDLNELKKAITKNTSFISIMYVNNVMGAIQPIREIGQICKDNKIIFHTDACQAAQFESLDTKMLNVDLMTINSSKIHGPKGVGALYINQNIKLSPTIYGGGQE